MDKGIFKRLFVPMFFLLLCLIPALYWDAVIYQVGSEFFRRTIWVGRYVIGICLWLACAWLLIRIIDDVVWPLVLERRLGYIIPRLLKDLVRLVVLVIAVGVIISVVFEKSITGFLAAIGVTTAPIARVRLPNERGMEYIVVYEVPEYRFRGRMRAAMMRSIMHRARSQGRNPWQM